jgi:hypothetical protein
MESTKLYSIVKDSLDSWNGVTSILSNSDPELKELFDASDPVIRGRIEEIPVVSLEDCMSQYTALGEMGKNAMATVSGAVEELADLAGGSNAGAVVTLLKGSKDLMDNVSEYMKHGFNDNEKTEIAIEGIQVFIKSLSALSGTKTAAVLNVLDSLVTLQSTLEQIKVYNANKQALLDAGVPYEFVSAYSISFTKNIMTGIADLATALFGVAAEVTIEGGSNAMTIFEKGLLALADLNPVQAQIQANLKGKADYYNANVNTQKDELEVHRAATNLELMAMAYALEDTK